MYRLGQRSPCRHHNRSLRALPDQEIGKAVSCVNKAIREKLLQPSCLVWTLQVDTRFRATHRLEQRKSIRHKRCNRVVGSRGQMNFAARCCLFGEIGENFVANRERLDVKLNYSRQMSLCGTRTKLASDSLPPWITQPNSRKRLESV